MICAAPDHIVFVQSSDGYTWLSAAASSSLVKMREVPLSRRAPVDAKLPTVFVPTVIPLKASAQYLRRCHVHLRPCISGHLRSGGIGRHHIAGRISQLISVDSGVTPVTS